MSAVVITKNQKIDFHGITGTVAAINNDEVVIHFGAGEQRIVRTLSRADATYFVEENVFGVRAQLSRPVNNEQGKYAGCDSMYITDNHTNLAEYVVEISLVANAGAMGAEERFSPHKTAVLWWLQGLPEKPEIVIPKGAKRYTPKVADDQPAEVTDADDMVSRKDHEKALSSAIEAATKTSIRNAQLVKDKEELTAQLEDERRQNLTLIMDNVNLQDKVESLERKVAALAIRVPVDIKYTQVNLSQYETKDALLKDLRDGWEVAHETVLENSPTIYRYRLVQYGKLPDPLPMPRHTSAAAPAANGAGQYIMQGNNANIVASQSMPQGLPLTFNRPAQRRGETRRIPHLQQSNMRLGAKLIDLQERSDQRVEEFRRALAQQNPFTGANS